jgi:hypothetical protein
MRSRVLTLAIVLAFPLAACADRESPTDPLLDDVPALSEALTTFEYVSYDCHSQTQIPAQECEALVALYIGTGGSGWTNSSGWLETETPCEWYGVSCAQESVSGLLLQYNYLTGNIPADLGEFANLHWLHLYGNQLSGSIPPELGGLTNLRELYLYGNLLTGSIPSELGNLTNLLYLWLDGNQLTGPIPPELGDLGELRQLFLGHSQLSGPIPPELGKLGNLQMLNVAHSRLTGSIPAEIGNLGRLRFMSLHHNQLTGTIPEALGRLTNLEDLHLFANQLSGIVPLSVAQLGGSIQFTHGPGHCQFLPELVHVPGNDDLYIPDTEAYRAADLADLGSICFLGFTATPETVAEDLTEQITELYEDGVVNSGLRNSLIIKIDQAMSPLARGQHAEAMEVLQGFIQQVDDLTPAHLTAEQAAVLIEMAEVLMALIEMEMPA